MHTRKLSPFILIACVFCAGAHGGAPTERPDMPDMQVAEAYATAGELGSASAQPLLSVDTHWWGATIDFTKSEMCEVLSATTSAAMTLILSSLGVPPALVAPIAAYVSVKSDELLDHYVGEEGTTLEVTWIGIVKGIERRGPQAFC